MIKKLDRIFCFGVVCVSEVGLMGFSCVSRDLGNVVFRVLDVKAEGSWYFFFRVLFGGISGGIGWLWFVRGLVF